MICAYTSSFVKSILYFKKNVHKETERIEVKKDSGSNCVNTVHVNYLNAVQLYSCSKIRFRITAIES